VNTLKLMLVAMAAAVLGTAQVNPNYPPYQTLPGTGWTFSGGWTEGNAWGGYTYYGYDPNAGAPPTFISTVSGGNEYEVRLSVICCGDVVAYLRATADANFYTDTGTFYAVRISCCFGQVSVYRRQSGVTTLLGSGYPPTSPNPGTLRAIIAGGEIHVFYNDVNVVSLSENAITSGQPGFGLGGYGVVNAGVYARDTTSPSGLGALSVSAAPSQVDLQWGSVSDGNGIGVWNYWVYRNNVFIGSTEQPAFTDTTVSPSTTYSYQVTVKDYHVNYGTTSGISIATPASGSGEPRRVGVRANGAYWGGGNEQIDMRSGNLNVTLPLVTTQARAGKTTTIALSYNSQFWRKDDAGLRAVPGDDVGLGLGWRLMAGALTPYWSSYYTVHHYVFTDATGAAYALDAQTTLYSGGPTVWASKDGANIWYNPATNQLQFPDGSYWVMGQLAGSWTASAGTRYPTKIQDSNGNYTTIAYQSYDPRITSVTDVCGGWRTCSTTRRTGRTGSRTSTTISQRRRSILTMPIRGRLWRRFRRTPTMEPIRY
jgi:hypothetical protein